MAIFETRDIIEQNNDFVELRGDSPNAPKPSGHPQKQGQTAEARHEPDHKSHNRTPPPEPPQESETEAGGTTGRPPQPADHQGRTQTTDTTRTAGGHADGRPHGQGTDEGRTAAAATPKDEESTTTTPRWLQFFQVRGDSCRFHSEGFSFVGVLITILFFAIFRERLCTHFPTFFLLWKTLLIFCGIISVFFCFARGGCVGDIVTPCPGRYFDFALWSRCFFKVGYSLHALITPSEQK